jgi:hypothetical protein
MPAYLNDDELFFALRACRRLEDIAARVATGARQVGHGVPPAADARQMQECAASVRVVLERAEARGKVH